MPGGDTSDNGWQVIPSGSSGDLTTVSVAGHSATVHAGSPATTFQTFLTAYHARVESVRDLGGYAYRANVNNPSAWSCHASGTAVDINASAHPNGTTASRTMSPAVYAAAKKLASEYAGQLLWLETTDPMHWQIAYGPDGTGDTTRTATYLDATTSVGGVDLGAVSGFVSNLMNPAIWVRIAETLCGALLIVAGLIVVFRQTKGQHS